MVGRFVALLSLLVVLAAPANAGQYRAHLRGRILDAAGAPAPAVPMRITSEATGEARRFVSGADGRYVVADLQPGTYRIESDSDRHRGFLVRTSVAINQDAELDLQLGTSAIAMAGDVRPTLIPLDRHSPAVTTRLDPLFLQRLPFETRSYLDASLLASGMVPGFFGPVAGGTGDAFTGYIVDGLAWLIDPGLAAPPVRLPLDAIAEMEVRTSTYDASFGRAAGAQVNVVSRSGTNRLQGGAEGLLQPDGERALFGGFAGGPLAENRTFAFGNYQLALVDDEAGSLYGDGHLLAARVDHLLNPSMRLTARYGLDTEAALGHAQNGAVSLHSAGAGAFTNEVRLGFSRADTSELVVVDSTTVQFADVATYVRGAHLLRGGVEWYRRSRTFDAREVSASMLGLFVQDDWWVRPDVSVSAGIRYDWSSPETEEQSGDSNTFSPRVGFTWTPLRLPDTIVRGGYGIDYNHLLVAGGPPRLDQWSLGVERSLGRARSIEATYLGSRGRDLDGRSGSSDYNAVQFTLEERSEANVSALVSYTYGKWEQDVGLFDENVRAPLDSRHRLSLAFVAALPFGNERRWFTDGLAARILGDLELSGIVAIRSGRPSLTDPFEQLPGYRSLDVALIKHFTVANQRALQVRFETYNVMNRQPNVADRRYQFGGRIHF